MAMFWTFFPAALISFARAHAHTQTRTTDIKSCSHFLLLSVIAAFKVSLFFSCG